MQASGGGGGSGAYQPDGSGEIVIEAEHFDANTASGLTAWVPVQTPGYVGDGAMQASPDSGRNVNVPAGGSSPRLDFEVEYAAPVLLNAWIRGVGPDWSGDSLWIGVNGDITTAIRMSTVPKGGFDWGTFARAAVTTSRGTHDQHLDARRWRHR